MNYATHLALLTISEKKKKKKFKKEEKVCLNTFKNSLFKCSSSSASKKTIVQDSISDYENNISYNSFISQPHNNYYASKEFVFSSKSKRRANNGNNKDNIYINEII
ncbi:hypothetical protein U3516DRAFT_849460 [Neocallimastix sp. 'constans']